MEKAKPVGLSGDIAVFTGKQAVFAPVFRAPREKGTGILPSGKRPAPSERIRAAKQHIQPSQVLLQSPVYTAFRHPNFHLITANTCSALRLTLDFMYSMATLIKSLGRTEIGRGNRGVLTKPAIFLLKPTV
jgi:hypothetical protein